MASATPDLRLPSQPRGITALWPLVPNYTAWWQRHICVNNLPKVVTQQCPGAESNLRLWVTSGLQVRHVTVGLPSHTSLKLTMQKYHQLCNIRVKIRKKTATTKQTPNTPHGDRSWAQFEQQSSADAFLLHTTIQNNGHSELITRNQILKKLLKKITYAENTCVFSKHCMENS